MNPLRRLRLTCSTVAHLRPDQVSNRIGRRLRPFTGQRLSRASWELRGVGRPVGAVRRGDGGFDGRSFSFLNLRHPFEGEARWRPKRVPALWSYHLHYLDYLEGLPPADALRLLDDWMDANRPRTAPGWDPYPTSLRLRSWLEWLVAHWPGLDAETRRRHLGSLAVQAELLRQLPERHLRGNHLLENAVSLCWAGLRLDGPASEAWLLEGLELLEAELGDQVLAEGTHEERSPSYQARVCEALFRLAEVAEVVRGAREERVGNAARTAARRMLGALARLSHPDGEVALLNDSGLGWAPTAPELAARFDAGAAITPDEGLWSLPDAGYGGIRTGDTYFVFDAGPIGPDHQPGHGHADTLAFELSVAGERLVTDTGVFTYEVGEKRDWDRGTAAHSTVQVNGRDQCELWEAFRCGRRPVITDHKFIRLRAGEVVLHGAIQVPITWTESYRHARTMGWHDGVITVRDELSGTGRHRATLRLHLAPEVEVAGTGREVTLDRGGARAASITGDLDWRVQSSPYHPDFHVEVDRRCLVAEVPFEGSLETEFRIDTRRA